MILTSALGKDINIDLKGDINVKLTNGKHVLFKDVYHHPLIDCTLLRVNQMTKHDSEGPEQKLDADIAGSFKTSLNKNKYFLIIVDDYCN